MRRSTAHEAPLGVAASTLKQSGPGGLLPWQGAVLAGVCGILSLLYPVPGGVAAAVLWLVWCLLGGRPRVGLGMAAAFLLGLALAWMHVPEPPVLPSVVGSGTGALMRGTVAQVDRKPGNRVTVLLEEVDCTLEDGRVETLPGKLAWFWHHPNTDILPGQEVQLWAPVNPITSFGNPGGFDYALDRQLHDVHTRIFSRGGKSLRLGPSPATFLQRWKRFQAESIFPPSQELDAEATGEDEVVDPRQGQAMLGALLLGDRLNLTPETVALVRTAGLSHTLALSGLHLGFVVMLGAALALGVSFAWPGVLLRLPRPRLAVVIAAPLVLFYLWLGGFTPSLLRASLMFAFMGYFLLKGRGRVVLDGLFFALVVILVADPLAVFDVRLQLSACAVAGIGLFMPVVMATIREISGLQYRPVRWAAGLLAVSLCATVVIMPLTARTFGLFAPNLLMNLVWLPLLGCLVMPAGLLGLLLSPLWQGAANGCYAVASSVLEGMLAGLGAVQDTGALPMIQLLRPMWPQMLGGAVLLACLAACFRLSEKYERRLWGAVVLGLGLMIGPHVSVMAEDSTALRLEVVDVGQGQSLVITVPGGRRTVIDGGGFRSKTFDAGRDVVAPFLTYGRAPRVEQVILTHPHADHYKGLIHLLRYFDVQEFIYGGHLPGGSYEAVFEALSLRFQTRRGQAGDVLELGHDLQLATLYPAAEVGPESTNDTSLVQRLQFHGKGLALLCGDAENTTLKTLVAANQDLRAQVLVLPHHGSKTSDFKGFYERVKPEIALCSSGFRNRHIQPYPRILEHMRALGAEVYSTWQSGLLRAQWTGDGVLVRCSFGR